MAVLFVIMVAVCIATLPHIMRDYAFVLKVSFITKDNKLAITNNPMHK